MNTGMPAKQPRLTPSFTWLIALVLVSLSGCESEERVNTVSVLANTNCKGAPQGITEVGFADIARFRGSELVIPEGSAENVDDDLPVLVALSRGPQPSRGFELHLANQARVVADNALELEVYWTEPDTSKSQPLVTTTPCLVVSVPEGPWQRIEATDQNGISLGSLIRRP